MHRTSSSAIPTRNSSVRALLGSAAVVALLGGAPAVAQTTVTTDTRVGTAETVGAAPATAGIESPGTDAAPRREGTADMRSVIITLSSQATEIRQILMEGGELGVDGLEAAIRAQEIATQAVEATDILGNPGDPQVTTTRMSDMDIANRQFIRMAEALDIRVRAIRAGDETAANRARLAVIDAINELPDSIRFEGRAASGDNPTGEAGGAQPILQQ